ncbi:MAG: PEP-CTERM sorting domain-containing protein [Bryobacterales bacterium]|nr:PEP-CTERM sorting domain-containing protein [Bryobacterales bacterium]
MNKIFLTSIGFFALAYPSQAAQITFRYEGAITRAQDLTLCPTLPQQACADIAIIPGLVGEILRVEYSYDDVSIVNSFAGSSTRAGGTDLTGLATITMGSNVFNVTGFSISIQTGSPPVHSYIFSAGPGLVPGSTMSGPSVLGFSPTSFQMMLFDDPALSILDFPSTIPDPASFASSSMSFVFGSPNLPLDVFIEATDLRLARAVPEPSSLVLLTGALAIFSVLRRRRAL